MKPEKYMCAALSLAKKALSAGEVPIGAVVVDSSGKIIGRGFNLVETMQCQSEHAEARAIRQACRKVGWRLDGCSLFVTLEPCLMCFGLIGLARVKKIYFGAHSPLFGITSAAQLKSENQGSASLISNGSTLTPVYRKGISMHGGLKAKGCADILRMFFSKARIKKG